jgi:hypothetical protein
MMRAHVVERAPTGSLFRLGRIGTAPEGKPHAGRSQACFVMEMLRLARGSSAPPFPAGGNVITCASCIGAVRQTTGKALIPGQL